MMRRFSSTQVKFILTIFYLIVLSKDILNIQGQSSSIAEENHRTLELGEGLETSNEASEEDSIDNDDESDDPKKFDWKIHQDDHSIYAHRSLMSTAGIRSPALSSYTENGGEEFEVDPDEGLRLKPGEADEDLAPLRTVDFVEKEWQLMFRSFDLMFDKIRASLVLGEKTDLLEEIVSRLKPECRRDIDHIRRSMKQHKLWALRMIDSIGKIPSGVTYGKFSSPGDYEECLSVRVDEQVYTIGNQKEATRESNNQKALYNLEHHKFHGKYCLIDFRLPLPERPKDKLLSIHDPVIDLANTELIKQFPELANYSGYASVFYEVGYMHAVCLPSTCDVQDLTRSIGKALEGLHIIVNNTVDCEEKLDGGRPWRTSQVISAILMVVVFANAALATIMRYLNRKHIADTKKELANASNRNETNKDNFNRNWLGWATKISVNHKSYADCFSIQTNFERLSKPDPRGLTFVHYTRIVAMGLTVITHTAGLGTLQAITKPADASKSEQIFRDLIPQMLANAFTSIQIFFFMAGFMLVISTYPSINREKGHVSFVEYAIKRAIRLLPGLAATICLNFLWPLIVDGPMLSYFIRLIVEPCEHNWWRTLAFLSNFDHVEKMCLRHSYFSASDYQLHIVAFPLLILLYKRPTLSLIIAAILTLTGFVAQVTMILTKRVLPFMMVDYIDKEAFFNVVHYIHHPSWNHMSAFFYGFIVGFMVVKQIRINLGQRTIKRLWCTILPLGVLSIFAPYFWNHYKRPIYRWQMVLYVIIDRFALLTACAWLSYATMVLGRKPAKKNHPTSDNTNINSASRDHDEIAPSSQNTVSLSMEKRQRDSSCQIVEPKEQAQKLEDTWTNSLLAPEAANIQSTDATPNLTRQRSSPDIQNYKQQDHLSNSFGTTLRSATSSSNVHSESAAQDHLAAFRQHASVGVGRPEAGSEPKTADMPVSARRQAPISNVNTLCLILSRLTFQLYLFNMVVLWIDVNHSKYYWFFSYYFIIMKALAVYICSSLMALVFFVTLESPSLTLYIMWVKGRAQKRATQNAGSTATV